MEKLILKHYSSCALINLSYLLNIHFDNFLKFLKKENGNKITRTFSIDDDILG